MSIKWGLFFYSIFKILECTQILLFKLHKNLFLLETNVCRKAAASDLFATFKAI
jgi:hypothetical protein